MTLCNHWFFFPGNGDLEVLIEVECGDREISIAFRNGEMLLMLLWALVVPLGEGREAVPWTSSRNPVSGSPLGLLFPLR